MNQKLTYLLLAHLSEYLLQTYCDYFLNGPKVLSPRKSPLVKNPR